MKHQRHQRHQHRSARRTRAQAREAKRWHLTPTRTPQPVSVALRGAQKPRKEYQP